MSSGIRLVQVNRGQAVIGDRMNKSNLVMSSKPLARIIVGLFLGLVLGIMLYLFSISEIVNTTNTFFAIVAMCLSPAIPAFLINLILPVSRNKRDAIVVSIPIFAVLLYCFSIKPYYEYLFVPEMQRDIWNTINLAFCCGPITAVGSSAFTALAGWAGSWIHQRINQVDKDNV
jgi:hypothetical protein